MASCRDQPEHLFGLDVPFGDDARGIHPDEAIERHLDDAPCVGLALAQRRFGVLGNGTLLLRMPIFPSYAFHGPQQESKRGYHHGATRRPRFQRTSRIGASTSRRSMRISTVQMHTLKPATGYSLA